ncbi:hypothetical protein GCM10028805_65190 [Spirosoma harenae]
MQNDEIPDYLPDGSIHIHGKLASKPYVTHSQSKGGRTKTMVYPTGPSTEEMIRQMNDEMDKAYRSE